jgi:WD40 repeat protein
VSDVFISYSRKDSRFVGALAEGLRSKGKDVWIDIEGIRDGEVFPAALRSAIDSSDGFVFVISPASVHSDYCAREVENAVEAGKRIVPVDLEHVADEELPEPIRVRNWIPASDDLGATVDRVVTALNTDLEHLREHTHWELKALEWEAKGREHAVLVHGTELAAAEAWLAPAELKDPPPTPLQREFLTASRQAAATRQRRIAIVAVGVALVSLALLIFALIARSEAQNARKTNESRAIAFLSEAQDAVDPERALLFATEAAKTRATPDAQFALRAALDADPLLHRFPSFGAQNCPAPAPGVAFSPDGLLAIGLCDGRILLANREQEIIETVRQPYPAAPLRFNSDGSTLAVAGSGRITLYDAHSLKPRGHLLVPGSPQRIVFSGEGDRMAATSVSATRSWTSVWNTLTGERTMRRISPAPTNGISALVRGIGFIDGGRALALGSPTGAVAILASDGGRRLRTLPDKEDALIGVDPDGRWLVVGGFHTHGAHSREGVVTLWDTRTWGKPRTIATAQGLRPSNIVVSRDGTRVVVGWSDGSTGIYSLQLGSQLQRFLGPPKPVSSVNYSQDSSRVAVGAADGSVRIWRTGGVETAYAEMGSRLDWDEPAVTNNRLTIVTPPSLVRTLSLPTLIPLSTMRLPLPPGARYVHAWLSPSGRIAVLPRSDGRADVWNLRDRHQVASLPALPGALAAVSTDDTRMLLLDGKNNEIVDLRTNAITPIRQRARHCRGQWQAARFSDDGSIVVAGAICGEVFAWNTQTGNLIYRVALPGQVSAMALTHDKRIVAVASPDGRFTLIGLGTGAQVSIPGAPRGVISLDFGPGDKTLAGGIADKTVRIWDVASRRLLRVLPLAAAATARFTPNGRRLVVSDLTGALKVIDPCPSCQDTRALLVQAKRRVTRGLTSAERQSLASFTGELPAAAPPAVRTLDRNNSRQRQRP